MDEIVDRVVDQLREAELGETAPADEDDRSDGHDIEVHVDENESTAGADGEGSAGRTGPSDESPPGSDEDGPDEGARRRGGEPGQRRRDADGDRRESARRRRAVHDRGEPFEDLGDRIETAVEAQLDRVADHIERSFPGAPGPAGAPTLPSVVIGPDDTREKAIYKTQLQKGGRVAVPDTEIEALDLEPGDTLQVVLYPVE